MPELHFDIRDILKAPRLAWSLRKMHVAIRGIAVAWVLYAIMAYLSLLLTETGRSAGVSSLFRCFEYFPWLPLSFGAGWQYIPYGLGCVLAAISLLSTATALARITFEDVRGNDIFRSSEALHYARSHRVNVVLCIGLLLVISGVINLSLVIWGLIGRIPVIGPVIFGISVIPVIFWGILGVVIGVVSVAAFHLAPAITAALGKDVLETIIQCFSTVFYRPCRLLVYELTAYSVVAISTLILAAISIKAMYGTAFFCSLFFGNSFSELFTTALYRIPGAIECTLSAKGLFDYVPVQTLQLVDTTSVALSVRIAGWLAGSGALFVLLWVLSYGFSCFTATQLLTYLALRKHRDGNDLRLKQGDSYFIPETPSDMNETP